MIPKATSLMRQPEKQAQEIKDWVFRGVPPDPFIELSSLRASGSQQIGYRVPSSGTALATLTGFSIALLFAGLLISQRHGAENLALAVPIIAGIASLPIILIGMSYRDIAPPTIVHQSVVKLESGQSELIQDGMATIYQPEPSSVQIDFPDYSLVDSVAVNASAGLRYEWSDTGQSQCQLTDQAAGIQQYSTHSTLSLNRPITADISFNSSGMSGRLSDADLFQPEDPIIAGMTPDYLIADIDSYGNITATSSDIPTPGVFMNAPILSDTQLQRSKLYESLFRHKTDGRAFPLQPCLLFWSDMANSSLFPEVKTYSVAGTTLFIQPLTLKPPAVGEGITIPPVFLPYTAVRDNRGGVSAAYNNNQRVWQERQQPGITMLAFDVPEVCRPFSFDNVDIKLRIQAGSRPVRIQGGTRDNLMFVRDLDGRVGQFDMTFSPELLSAINGKDQVYLQIEIGDVASANEDVIQEQFWKIDRVMMTAKGHRKE